MASSRATPFSSAAGARSAITRDAASGFYRAGQVIPIAVQFTEGIYLAGTNPLVQLILNNGKVLTLAPPPGATSPVFNYTVGAADMNTPDLNVGAVLLNGTGPSLRDAAVELQRGGVGYYRGPDFVHVDTGRVRRW